MIPLWAVELLKKYWLHMLIALAVMLYTGFIYWEGGRGPRAELTEFQAKVDKERAEEELADAEDEAASQQFIYEQDRRHDARIETINRTWANFVAGLQQPASPKQPGQSVSIPTGICEDPSRDPRLHEAISGYRDEVRRIIERERSERRSILATERTETSGLLAPCQKQTDSLVETQEWAAHEKQVWDAREENPSRPKTD